MALAVLRVEAGFDLALDGASETTVEFSRLLSGFLVVVVRFVAVGKDVVGAVGFVVALVLVVLVAAGAAGVAEVVLLRVEALVAIPVAFDIYASVE